MLTPGLLSRRTRATSQRRTWTTAGKSDGAFPEVDMQAGAACCLDGGGPGACGSARRASSSLRPRALLRALELAIASGLGQRRAVFLVDNMSVALSFARGRTKGSSGHGEAFQGHAA